MAEGGIINGLLTAMGLPPMYSSKGKGQSPAQAQEAMTGAQAMAPEQLSALDAQARAAGYPNYEAMKMNMMQKSRGASTQQGALPPAETMQNNAMAWHPKNMFQSIADTIGNVIGQ